MRILCGTILLAAACCASAMDAGTLRVATWNIGHFAMGKGFNPAVEVADSAVRAAEYREKIAAIGVDILGVSEYDPIFDKVGTPATNAVFASFPSKAEGPKNRYQCNAVFSRFPIVRREVVDYEARFQKTYFLDTVVMIGTNEVHYVQTHLDWNSNETAADARPRQIRQLIDHFKDVPHVIISGDWNVYGASEYYPFLMAGYELANCGSSGCIDTVRGNDRRMPCRRYPLDNIVVKGFHIRDVFTDDDQFSLSDHKILGCEVELSE